MYHFTKHLLKLAISKCHKTNSYRQIKEGDVAGRLQVVREKSRPYNIEEGEKKEAVALIHTATAPYFVLYIFL